MQMMVPERYTVSDFGGAGDDKYAMRLQGMESASYYHPQNRFAGFPGQGEQMQGTLAWDGPRSTMRDESRGMVLLGTRAKNSREVVEESADDKAKTVKKLFDELMSLDEERKAEVEKSSKRADLKERKLDEVERDLRVVKGKLARASAGIERLRKIFKESKDARDTIEEMLAADKWNSKAKEAVQEALDMMPKLSLEDDDEESG